MFSPLGYLVHLHGSLRPLQRDGVGFLQPLGHGFLEPLVEIAQSQRSIPVDEGTSFSQCTVIARGYHLTRKKLCPMLRKNLRLEVRSPSIPPRNGPETLLVMLTSTPATNSLVCQGGISGGGEREGFGSLLDLLLHPPHPPSISPFGFGTSLGGSPSADRAPAGSGRAGRGSRPWAWTCCCPPRAAAPGHALQPGRDKGKKGRLWGRGVFGGQPGGLTPVRAFRRHGVRVAQNLSLVQPSVPGVQGSPGSLTRLSSST